MLASSCQVALGTRCLPTGFGALQFSSYTRTTVAKADDSIQLLHAIHKGIQRGTGTRWLITFIVCECLTEVEPFVMCKMQSSSLTRHSLLVSTIRSPNTNPQPPQTRSPLLNSSTIFGFGSRHSGQISRTFRSGPNVCAFC